FDLLPCDLFSFFFFYCYRHHRDLHSFPTRRSSDLVIEKHTFPMSNTHTPNFVIQEIIRIIQDMMENHNLSIYEIIGIGIGSVGRSEEHTSELQSRENLVCRLLLEKKKKKTII